MNGSPLVLENRVSPSPGSQSLADLSPIKAWG